MKIQSVSRFAVLIAAMATMTLSAFSQSNLTRRCSSVGGTMSTDLAIVDPATSLGTATGDLKGAVTAAILSVTQNSDGTVSFTVQHHLVTESGDTISFSPATAVTMPLSQTRYAVIRYPVHINGGTGKYANAHGDMDSIGEVDLGSGQTVFRYSGTVCLVTGN